MLSEITAALIAICNWDSKGQIMAHLQCGYEKYIFEMQTTMGGDSNHLSLHR